MGKGYITALNFQRRCLCYYEDGYIYPDIYKRRILGGYKNGELYVENWNSLTIPSYEYRENYIKPRTSFSAERLLTVQNGNVYKGQYSMWNSPIARAEILEGTEGEAACAAFVILKDMIIQAPQNTTNENIDITSSGGKFSGSSTCTNPAIENPSGGFFDTIIGMLALAVIVLLVIIVAHIGKYLPIVFSLTFLMICFIRYSISDNKRALSFGNIVLGLLIGVGIGLVVEFTWVFLGLTFGGRNFVSSIVREVEETKNFIISPDIIVWISSISGIFLRLKGK